MSKALRAAIEANDPDAVSKALKGVKDINRKLPGAKAPLLLACATGADKVLEVLFDAGAASEKRHTFPGDTPFAVAANHRQFGVMARLLELQQASDKVVRFVTENACIDGNAEVLDFILEKVQPDISIELVRLAAISSNGPMLLKMLVEHGADLNARHDSNDAKMITPLHAVVNQGNVVGVIQALVECGADVNVRDGIGRTPLMVLAASLEDLEFMNDRIESMRENLEDETTSIQTGEPPTPVNCLEALQKLLSLGADATLLDYAGNDALDYYTFGYLCSGEEPAVEIINLLREAGAKGSQVTLDMFRALKQNNFDMFRHAIQSGADVNRSTPPPESSTPLIWAANRHGAESLEYVRALLQSGADPNKMVQNETALISASQRQNLAVVQELVKAGADIHLVSQVGDSLENAYSASYQSEEVRHYLKSLGARNPVHESSQGFTPGVANWNMDFSELLVKGTVHSVAVGLARMIQGKIQSDAYGLSVTPGKQAYIVLKPKGMEWCNVLQIAPPLLRFDDEKKRVSAASALAKACDASVLLLDYSDCSGGVSTVQIEPSGGMIADQGLDRDLLCEMVEAMGQDAPSWAKDQLEKADEDDLSSVERLDLLAQKEKFVVAAFGLRVEPDRKVDIEFTGYGKDAFDGVCYVSI